MKIKVFAGQIFLVNISQHNHISNNIKVIFIGHFNNNNY